MLKKLVIAAAAVVVGLVILKKTDFGSLVQVCWKDGMTWCGKQVSPETRIKQLRLEIGKIDEDIKTAINGLVKVEVSHDRLKTDIARLQTKQEQRAKDMQALATALKQNSKQVTFNDQQLPSETAQNTLRSLTNQYRNGKVELKEMEERFGVLSEQVQLADEQLTKLKNKKDELLAVAGKLESKLARLRTKQLDTGVEVNDTQVNKCERLANQTEEALQEMDKRAEKYARYGLVPTPVVKEVQNKADAVKAAEEELKDQAKGAREQ